MTVGLIWAQAANGVIGRDGALPWHLPEDLAHFRTTTADAAVVMGRRTWDSLPPRFRPLPGRRNLVLTRDPQWSPAGALPSPSIERALADVDGDVWIIGGGSVYSVAVPFADRAVVTELREPCEGDTFAPALGTAWQLTATTDWLESVTAVRYRIREYDHIR